MFTSETGNEYMLLVVNNASKPSKEAYGVARIVQDLCLAFEVPFFIGAGGGGVGDIQR